MKTLEQIIEREDYKKLTVNLKDRTLELAEKMMRFACELGLDEYDEFKVAGLCFNIKVVKSRSGFSQRHLFIRDEYYYEALTLRISQCLFVDYNCYVRAASNSTRLVFLNKAKQIFKELEDIQNRQIEKIETALKESENL